MHTSARIGLVWLAVTVGGGAIAGQSAKSLSIDAIYDPDSAVDFNGRVAPDPVWIDDAQFLQRTGGRWQRVDADSGRTVPLVETGVVEAALARIPGVSAEQARTAARGGQVVAPGQVGLLVTVGDDLAYVDLRAGTAARLTATHGPEEEASFSPDGRLVAFVRAHDLFVVDVATRRERALTTDGTPQILNGRLDWLYQEEIYGRGNFRGYWWSPDSRRLAYLQLDERQVPSYTVTDHLPYRPVLEVTPYPKAGDRNPAVRLGVVGAGGGGTTWVDLREYEDAEPLIVNVGWTPDGRLVHQVQDRAQTWLDLRLSDAGASRARRLLRETTSAWVNENGNPVWLPDGSFLWISERSGFRHVYHHAADGRLLTPVTGGRWDVRSLYGVDARNGLVYVAATERSAIGMDIYSVRLDGSGLTRLSTAAGTHRAAFNPGFTRYVDTWSTVTTPPQVRLHDAAGGEIRVIDANPVPALGEYGLSTPEFVQVKTRDGFVMDGMLIKPPDFTPSRRYPVYQFTYAGPGAQSVRDRWGGAQYLFHQLLAQRGVIVWILDNRSASGKGVESQWPVWGRLGELELQDLEDGATWLRAQPFVDPERLVLSGWSYGGFMTAYALTHSTTWSAGVVGAPVTDWRDYDSVYTERLMKLPKDNPDGYRRTAPRFAASALQARLLLVHGTMDDNVHMQNSVQFAYELQRAGKPFEMMTYARSRHGFEDPLLIRHLQQLTLDFVLRAVAR